MKKFTTSFVFCLIIFSCACGSSLGSISDLGTSALSSNNSETQQEESPKEAAERFFYYSINDYRSFFENIYPTMEDIISSFARKNDISFGRASRMFFGSGFTEVKNIEEIYELFNEKIKEKDDDFKQFTTKYKLLNIELIKDQEVSSKKQIDIFLNDTSLEAGNSIFVEQYKVENTLFDYNLVTEISCLVLTVERDGKNYQTHVVLGKINGEWRQLNWGRLD